jgi:hypothetical protein
MRGRPTKDPHTRPAIDTLERLHMELGGQIVENRQRYDQLRRPYFGRRGSSVGRSISSYVGTWVLFHHDSSAAPQTVQTASPVCGAKYFSSVRLYSAPQLH